MNRKMSLIEETILNGDTNTSLYNADDVTTLGQQERHIARGYNEHLPSAVLVEAIEVGQLMRQATAEASQDMDCVKL